MHPNDNQLSRKAIMNMTSVYLEGMNETMSTFVFGKGQSTGYSCVQHVRMKWENGMGSVSKETVASRVLDEETAVHLASLFSFHPER